MCSTVVVHGHVLLYRCVKINQAGRELEKCPVYNGFWFLGEQFSSTSRGVTYFIQQFEGINVCYIARCSTLEKMVASKIVRFTKGSFYRVLYHKDDLYIGHATPKIILILSVVFIHTKNVLIRYTYTEQKKNSCAHVHGQSLKGLFLVDACIKNTHS